MLLRNTFLNNEFNTLINLLIITLNFADIFSSYLNSKQWPTSLKIIIFLFSILKYIIKFYFFLRKHKNIVINTALDDYCD